MWNTGVFSELFYFVPFDTCHNACMEHPTGELSAGLFTAQNLASWCFEVAMALRKWCDGFPHKTLPCLTFSAVFSLFHWQFWSLLIWTALLIAIAGSWDTSQSFTLGRVLSGVYCSLALVLLEAELRVILSDRRNAAFLTLMFNLFEI